MTPGQLGYTAPQSNNCPYCGMIHTGGVEGCPAIKKIEYYPDGTIKSVEKKP